MRACSLTYHKVDVFTGAGRFDVLVVDDNESHFVSLVAETVDGYGSCGDFFRLYGLPRVRYVNFVLHSYSSHSVAPTLSYRLQVNKLSFRKTFTCRNYSTNNYLQEFQVRMLLIVLLPIYRHTQTHTHTHI